MMHTIAALLVTRAHLLRETVRDRRDAGATATEYGLLVTFVAVAIAIAVGAFGTELRGWFERMSDAVAGWDPQAPPAQQP